MKHKFNCLLFVSLALPQPGQARSVGQHVTVLDFSAQQSFGEPAAAAASPVAERMLSEFVSQPSTGPIAVANFAPQTPSDGAPFVHVPRWMKTGRPAHQIAATSPAIAIGACDRRTYRPSGLLGRTGEERRRMLYPMVQQVACQVGLPVGLFDAMLIQESGYNPFATSGKGAFGLGQLMPATARNLGIDRYSLMGNLTGAAQYLKAHLTEFGRADLALAAYNAGPKRVRDSGSVPRIAETRGYVRSIIQNWRWLEQF